MKTTDRLSCEAVFRLLDDFVDRELDARELALVEEHLAECAVCMAEHRFEKSVIEGVRGKLGQVRLPREVAERILASLPDADATSGD